MTTNRAYLIVPKLYEQPTWGGYYIMKAKGWEKHPAAKKKFGQSYELFSDSYVSLLTDTSSKDFLPEIDAIPEQSFRLEQIRSEDPKGLLGSRGVRIFDGALKTLIKFTQAKGNSFQLHVKPGTQNTSWKPKPESWYYFEKGLATLGLSDRKKLSAYKKACQEIEKLMHGLSQQVAESTLSAREARAQAQILIKKLDIYQYVNLITVKEDQVVDLSSGGTHHSWEEDENTIPNGNIVYEVQVDEKDEESSIRSFDKGKIGDDGAVRPVHIDDYFTHINTSKEANDPENFMKEPQLIDVSKSYKAYAIFNNPYYSMDRLEITEETSNHHTDTNEETFHHIFVKNGSINYVDQSITLNITEGHSVFIPAAIGKYRLDPRGRSVTLLKTFV